MTDEPKATPTKPATKATPTKPAADCPVCPRWLNSDGRCAHCGYQATS